MARPTLLSHRKFIKLAQRLQSDALALGHLEFIWHTANESGNPVLGDADDVEAVARWRSERGELVRALLECGCAGGGPGFIEQREDGLYEIHDYWDHAPDYVRKRARREEGRREKGKELRELTGQSRTATPQVTGQRPVSDQSVTGQNGTFPDCLSGVDRTPAPAPAPAPLLVAIDTSQQAPSVVGAHNATNGSQKPARRATATRLPEGFELTDARRAYAEREKLDPERTFEKFVDHWRAASGAKARKHDWDATWRNWCRIEADMQSRGATNGASAARPQQRRLTRYEEIAAIQQRSIDEAES